MIDDIVKKTEQVNKYQKELVTELKKLSYTIYDTGIEVIYNVNDSNIICIFTNDDGIFVTIEDSTGCHNKAITNLEWKYIEILALNGHLEAFLSKLNSKLSVISNNLIKILKIKDME